MLVVLINCGEGGVVGPFDSKEAAETYLESDGWHRETHSLFGDKKPDPDTWLKEKADGANTFVASAHQVTAPK